MEQKGTKQKIKPRYLRKYPDLIKKKVREKSLTFGLFDLINLQQRMAISP